MSAPQMRAEESRRTSATDAFHPDQPSATPAGTHHRQRCRQLSLRQPDGQRHWRGCANRVLVDPEVALAHPPAHRCLHGSERRRRTGRTPRIPVADSADGFDPLGRQKRPRLRGTVIGWLQKWTYDIAAQRMLGGVRFNPTWPANSAPSRTASSPGGDSAAPQTGARARNIQHPLNGRCTSKACCWLCDAGEAAVRSA